MSKKNIQIVKSTKNIPFGWAVIGSGYIVKRVLAEITKTDNHRLVSIYSRNYDTANQLAQKYGGISTTNIYDAIHQNGVEGVYIATPHPSHFDYLLTCIKSGIPVLCEKPIVLNSKQISESFILANKKKTYLSEIMHFKFSPIYIKTKKMIQSNKFGKLNYVKADIGFDAISLPKRKRLLSVDAGGGALYDIGIYLLALVEDLLGYTDIIDNSYTLFNGVDIVDKMLLFYNNIKCELECRFDQLTKTNAVLYFDNGQVIINKFFQPSKIEIILGNETTVLEHKFSYQYQFDSVSEDIRSNAKDNRFHTQQSIMNTIQMLERASKSFYN